jgi:hypothetical protein
MSCCERMNAPLRVTSGVPDFTVSAYALTLNPGYAARYNSTLPGLRMPLGSSACLSVRMSS